MSESKKVVLIVDDDREILHGAGMRLESAGYATLVAGDGVQALEMITNQHPDAIVLDQRMPRLDGMTVLRTVKADPKLARIPIIMLTADLSSLRPAVDAGARFVIKKPYQGRKLVTAVKLVLHESVSNIQAS